MKNDKTAVLAGTALFAGIDAATLSAMLGCLQPKIAVAAKNSFIAIEGEPFTGLGILLAGEAAVVKENVAGTRSMLTTLAAGDMFGEMVAFSALKTWPASVFAQSDCTVAFLPPQKITGTCPHACAGHQRLIRNMLLIVSEKALMLNRKVEYLTIRSMRAKIATYLLEQHKQIGKKTFVLPLKRNDLADFLNVSRTALSREMGRMRDEGLIEFFRSSVRIADTAALAKIVE
jgi:CRP-like cAMP-binding protein